MAEEDVLEGAISREELDRFKARHPSFAAAATRLQGILGGALNRPLQAVPGQPPSLQAAMFFLGRQAADDFFDIVLLGIHGYGIGAVKLLRPLYERVVTALYLVKHPREVDAFNAYGDILVGSFVHRAKGDGLDLSTAPAEWLVEVEKAYEAALLHFTDQRGRLRRSWTKLSLEALAREVGLKSPALEFRWTRHAPRHKTPPSAGSQPYANQAAARRSRAFTNEVVCARCGHDGTEA